MRTTIFLIMLLFSVVLLAQNKGSDMVYLKNGQIIRGTIIKQIPDSLVVIITNDGKTTLYKNKLIDKLFIFQDTISNKPIADNNLWMGISAEPQFQDVIKKKKDVTTFPPKAGVSGGFWLYFQAPKTIGFETGLQYHFYESKNSYSNTYPVIVYDLNKYHSIEIPVLLNLHTNKNKIRFYCAIGFAGGIMLADKEFDHVQDAGYIRDTSFMHHRDSTSTFYCTFMVRAGVELKLNGNTALKIGASLSLSAESVLGPTELYNEQGYALVPYSIGLNVAVLFNNGSKKKGRDW